jgi:hypothetical protein
MNTIAMKQRLLGQLSSIGVLLHQGLAFVGRAAVVLLLLCGKPVFPGESAADSTAVGAIRFDGRVSLIERADGDDAQKFQALVSHLSRRYRIASDVTEQFVGAAYDAGQQVGLDPLLILAVMAVESRFNPIAESGMGAKGLMQVIPKHHQDKLAEHGGEGALLDPLINIPVGARILKEYIRRTGSLEAGLQFYNGAMADPTSRYAQKVFAEKERIEQALSQFSRPSRHNSI